MQELLSRGLADLVIEPVVLENMLRAAHTRETQIINGLVPGNLTRALDGEAIGSTIFVE